MSKYVNILVTVRCKEDQMGNLFSILTQALNTHGYTMHSILIPEFKLKLVEDSDNDWPDSA